MTENWVQSGAKAPAGSSTAAADDDSSSAGRLKRGFVGGTAPSLSDPLGCAGTIVVVIIVVLALAAAAMFQLKLGPFASAGAKQNLLSGGASGIGEKGTICKPRAPILMMSHLHNVIMCIISCLARPPISDSDACSGVQTTRASVMSRSDDLNAPSVQSMRGQNPVEMNFCD